MKNRTSTSYDQTIKRKLHDDPEFAVEYLKAALEDTDEPKVLLIASPPGVLGHASDCRPSHSASRADGGDGVLLDGEPNLKSRLTLGPSKRRKSLGQPAGPGKQVDYGYRCAAQRA